MKPCRHATAEPECRICWLFDNRLEYRERWGGDENATGQPDDFGAARRAQIAEIRRRLKTPCVHLGAVLEVRPSCGCGSRHACAVHGECVRSGSAAKWRSCSSCPDYSSSDLADPA